MTEADVPAVVKVHMSSFPGFFLTFLGPRFLRLLYREVSREPGNVCLVAESEQRAVIGFVVGVSDQAGLYKRLARRRWFAFALASIIPVLRKPRVIPRLVRALLYTERISGASASALLMSIAVAPAGQGGGTGKALVARFLNEIAMQGVDKVSLATDRDNNQATNGFYHRLGFSLVREFRTAEGRWMNEYAIGIVPRNSQTPLQSTPHNVLDSSHANQ